MSQQGTPAAQKANGALSCTERAGKEGTDPPQGPICSTASGPAAPAREGDGAAGARGGHEGA